MSCLRRDLNPQCSAYCADALPTEPLRQLSWAGRIFKVSARQRRLSPDGQGNSNSVMRTCVHAYSVCMSHMLQDKHRVCLLVERSYRSISSRILTAHTSDIENCEGWLSPGGHSSGGRALIAKVKAPGSIPGGCRFFTVL